MNINWYSFYHKIRTLSITALALCLLNLIFDIYLGENNMFGTSPYDSVPYAAIAFIATAFSWMMVIKYKALRDIPETATKKARDLYSIIGISLIILFLVLVLSLPLIMR